MLDHISYNQKKALSQISHMDSVNAVTPFEYAQTPYILIQFKEPGRYEDALMILSRYGFNVLAVDFQELTIEVE